MTQAEKQAVAEVLAKVKESVRNKLCFSTGEEMRAVTDAARVGREGQPAIFWRMVCTSSAETRRHVGRRKVRPARWVNTTMSHVSG